MRFFDILSAKYKPLTRAVRTIMVVNSKGGCGKSTVATNLASYYAQHGANVVLADFDPQQSSTNWLAARDPERPPITALAAWKDALWIPRDTDTVVMDVAAGIQERRLRYLVRHAQTILIPVLPSAFDMRAASNFVEMLSRLEKVTQLQTKLAFVGNRVREGTRLCATLDGFLQNWEVPIVAHLREHQNYLQAAERGIGIHELETAAAAADVEQWQPLIKWLKTKASKPKPLT